MTKSYTQRRDEIVREVCHKFEDPKQDSFYAQQQAASQIDQLILDVIGEDHKYNEYGLKLDKAIENRVKHDLRNIIKGDTE